MLRDQRQEVEILESEVTYVGRVWAIVKDRFRLGGEELVRDYLQHMGAVAVVAIDEQERVLTIAQYRHPVGARMIEIPAGLLDDFDEDPLDAAARELLEESGYTAARYEVLVDVCTTPGSSSEAIRIFLATELQATNWSAQELHGEEKEITIEWVPLAQAVTSILNGDWQSPTAVAGILAYAARGNRELRAADSPWEMRQNEIVSGRVFRQIS
jgi:ADP-ribose pyrophosphatase